METAQNNLAEKRRGEGDQFNEAKSKRRCPPITQLNTWDTPEDDKKHLLGQFGIRRSDFNGRQIDNNPLHVLTDQHISHKDVNINVTVHRNASILREWYRDMTSELKTKIARTGFKPLIDALCDVWIDVRLMKALAEQWWDTTHTFHIEHVGEMTMTPTDFSAITGVRVMGKPLIFDKLIHRNTSLLTQYLGKPFTAHKKEEVSIGRLCKQFRNFSAVTAEEEDIVVRGFILSLIGSSIFAKSNNKVKLHYLSSLMDIEAISTYNWGAAGLAFIYHQMDDLCRGKVTTIGASFYIWQVWALEYWPSIRIFSPLHASVLFPRAITWSGSGAETVDDHSITEFYRVRLWDLTFDEVNWAPWGDVLNLPAYVQDSFDTTRKRILLLSAEGGAWYLGERVSVQSLGEKHYLVPKQPPKSMLQISKQFYVNHAWAVNGESAYQFIETNPSHSYAEFRRECLLPNRGTTKSIRGRFRMLQGECSQAGTIGVADNDTIPIPPWTILVPTTEGRPNIIRIPNDVNIENIDIPPHVKQVSITTATKLLQMIAGMHCVVVDNVIRARERLRQSAATIQNLRYRLQTYEQNEETNDNLRPDLESMRNMGIVQDHNMNSEYTPDGAVEDGSNIS